MATYEYLQCAKCKHYESYHHYPNPNAVARHYCKKCKDEIKYIKSTPISDYYMVWLPKSCYFNGYFEESDESKTERERKYTAGWEFYQIED